MASLNDFVIQKHAQLTKIEADIASSKEKLNNYLRELGLPELKALLPTASVTS
jgi:hypothetical protein